MTGHATATSAPVVTLSPSRETRRPRLLMTGLVGTLRMGRGVCLLAQACAVLCPWPAPPRHDAEGAQAD